MTAIIPNIGRIIADISGDLRGYGRSRIRREAAINARRTSQAIVAMQTLLFRQAVSNAIQQFPSYAEKVRLHCGTVPTCAANIRPEELPVWTKKDQRDLFSMLRAPPLPDAFIHATGGSTGEPTRFYVTRESYEWRVAVADRGYSWAGAEEGVRSFYIWSTPVHPPPPAKALKQKTARWLANRRQFSLFQFGMERKRECCEKINSFRPKVLVSYSGNLLELACFVRDNPGILQWKPPTIVGAAEGLPPGGREMVELYLGGKVFMSYGTREFMLIGMECCRHEGYHLSADNLFVEVVDEDGRTVKPGQTGRILVTDLRNYATPFIRYDVGDMGAMMDDSPCGCGCPFPRLARVEGRCGEFVELPDGSRLTAIFIAHTFKEFPWIDGFQIFQPDRNGIVIRLVTRDALDSMKLANLEQTMRDKMGKVMRMEFVRVSELEKTVSGKTLPVVRAP
jgi:phenylacetate-CoA ligase